MVRRAEQMSSRIEKNMRGGNGSVKIINVVERDEYKGKARLIAKIVLEKGSSIGQHIHENEEEIFYFIKGSGIYIDNGVKTAVNAGDSTLNLGGGSHSIINTGDGPLELMAVILTY